MESDELLFLRDQVKRLNSVLAEYQQNYPPVGLSSIKDQGNEEFPWAVDQSLMTPLLAEYDSNIFTLREEMEQRKRDQRELRANVDKLIAENKRLTKELKDSVQDKISTDELQPEDGETYDEDQFIQNLQYQLQMALQEKDSAMEMWQASVGEVERLEQQMQTQPINPQLHSLELQANQIKSQYVKTVAELNSEITALQDELSLSKKEARTSTVQLVEMKKVLDDMKAQLIKQEQERTLVTGSREMADSRASDFQKHSHDMQTQLEDFRKELEEAEEEKSRLEGTVIELQNKISDQESREYEATRKVRESVQMVEKALFEKDEVVVREKQSQEQLERLEKTLKKMADEAGSKTKKEVELVRQQCNNTITQLVEDIHALEMENAEKTAQIERSVRDKRAAESELEKLYQEGVVTATKDSGTYNELNSRACDAERLRDESLMKMEQMEAQLRRSEMKFRQEKSHMSSELDQTKDRLTHMNQEYEVSNEDRVRAMEKIDDLKRKLHKEEQEKAQAMRNLIKERTCLEHDMQLKQRELDVKVQSLEDSHRHASNELRQMLASNQRMCAKWKEECQTITRKFETKVNELRSDLSREKNRTSELSKLLKEARDKTADAEQMLTEYTRNIKRLEDRVRDAEHRASNATMQVTRQLRKDRNIIDERRQLKRELERSLRESTLQNEPDPLAVSDLASSYHKTNIIDTMS